MLDKCTMDILRSMVNPCAEVTVSTLVSVKPRELPPRRFGEVSEGIEPIFSRSYVRRVEDGTPGTAGEADECHD